MIVMKFGGSSLADVESLRRVAQLIERAESTPCVVLSAMADSTDRLLAIARLTGDDGDAALAGLFGEIAGIAERLLQQPLAIAAPFARLQREAERSLRSLIACDGTDMAAIDELLASGERLATLLLTALLRERGMRAREVDARDVMHTDASFGNARPDRARIAELAQRHLAEPLRAGEVLVIQGFVGCAPNGATTTLGRGGSDWSAALLGAALGVDELQIYTDVEGVMTCDPRAVADAQPIASLSPEEAAELAAFGARVLHPSTIQPVVDRDILVTVRHAMRPGGAITRISSNCHLRTAGLSALASRGPVTMLTMTSRRMLEASGYLARLFEVFGELDVPVDLVTTAEVSVTCTVDADAPVERLVAALGGLAHVVVREECAIVAAIGDGLQQTDHVLERACGALRRIEPLMVCFGGNSRNLSFVVRESERIEALERLHQEFFARGEGPPKMTVAGGQI